MDFSSEEILNFIDLCLHEDVGDGDHSSLGAISADSQAESTVYFKSDGILAGQVLASVICKRIDPLIQWDSFSNDGDWVKKGTIVSKASGPAQSLLKAERLLLNFMQRLSGIATTTAHAVSLVKDTSVTLLDTRKTTPGLRYFEKWAVKTGGGANHRFGLFDMVMLKDNHVDSAGSITKAVTSTWDYLQTNQKDLKIEVETRNLDEVKEALKTAKVDRIMLDNFTPEACIEAIVIIGDQCETEASGGIQMSNLKSYASTGVDFISLGFLTHSYESMDISMKTKLIK
jgi:nicotinate-nucleotide pyrophosphorylase (carboxylating)